MEILYVANARIPTDKANGKQIMKTCEALAALGNKVELLIPDRRQEPKFRNVDVFQFYHISNYFQVSRLFTLDLLELSDKILPRINFLTYILQELTFVMALVANKGRVLDNKTIYSRCLMAAVILKVITNSKIYYEAHNIGSGVFTQKIYSFLVSKLDGLVVISEGLQKKFSELGTKKIITVPDAADVKEISQISRIAARRKYSLGNKKIVVYTGQLTESKGVYTLVVAARKLLQNNKDIVFYLAGSSTKADRDNITDLAGGNENIRIVGPVPPHDYYIYQRAADVLILPGSAKFDNPRVYSSPLKLFEYLAAGVPMVATNVPANNSVLTHKINAYLVEPDNPGELAGGIIAILSDDRLAKCISKNALRCSKEYTWNKRAESILRFIR